MPITRFVCPAAVVPSSSLYARGAAVRCAARLAVVALTVLGGSAMAQQVHGADAGQGGRVAQGSRAAQVAGQQDQPDYALAGKPLPVAPADAQLQAALREVSPERIQQNIEHLVAFNNRSTVSSTETDLKPGTGVLAAADWIRGQFEAYSKACGGCLEVKVDAFVEQPQPGFGNSKPRIAKPTPLRNVYAILRGTDPAASQADVPGDRALRHASERM